MALTDEELLDVLDNYEDLLETQIDKNNTVEPDKLIDITAIDYLAKIRTIKDSTLNAPGDILQLISDRIPALSNGKIPVEVGSLNVSVSNASLEIANDVGNPVPISDAGGSITVDGSVSVTGTFWQATQPVSAASLPLPTGAATSSLQSTANTSLASIDTKTPSLGQALAAASTPVVLPAAQITALTPPTTVGVNSLPALSTGSNAIGSITNTSFGISGTLPAFTNTPTFNIGTAPTIAVTGAFYPAIQPVSLSTNTPTLQASSAIVGKVGIDQTTPGTTNKVSIGNDGTVAISGNLPAFATTPTFNIGTGAISNTSFAATQSGAWNITNISGTVSLPTGASTSALQTTGNTSLSSIDTKTPALGQALAAGSIPVVLPAAQITALTPLSTIAATQSGNWNIGSITTLPSLPTGANTIGAISNTAFSINGTLPAFATTPTFNLGTAPNLTFTNTSFIANAGTNLNTSALALESGGNLAGINTKLPSNLTVSASRLLVDGSGVTQPVSMIAAPPGLAYQSTATITRAANTTAYTANDVYGTVFELTNIGASGGYVFISSIDIIFNITALPSGMGAFAVYLYSSTPPSAIIDNLPFSLGAGDTPSCITPGGILLTASLARGGGSVVGEALNINRLIKLANNSTSLRAYLVTLGAFTPAANSETATITVEAFAP